MANHKLGLYRVSLIAKIQADSEEAAAGYLEITLLRKAPIRVLQKLSIAIEPITEAE